MTEERTSPSPPAGEGAEREKREAGEGARSLTWTARKLRSRMIDAADGWLAENGFRVMRFWNNDVLTNSEGVLTALTMELDRTPHPTSRLRSTSPSPARGEGRNQWGG